MMIHERIVAYSLTTVCRAKNAQCFSSAVQIAQSSQQLRAVMCILVVERLIDESSFPDHDFLCLTTQGTCNRTHTHIIARGSPVGISTKLLLLSLRSSSFVIIIIMQVLNPRAMSLNGALLDSRPIGVGAPGWIVLFRFCFPRTGGWAVETRGCCHCLLYFKT
jgi:hypothetical protein